MRIFAAIDTAVASNHKNFFRPAGSQRHWERMSFKRAQKT
jgi:hypothetical protein